MHQLTASQTKLLTALTKVVSQASDFNTTIVVALSQICEATDWDYGEVWIPEKDSTILKLSPVWCVSTEDSGNGFALEQFQECSKAFILHRGEGLPGRVWSSGQPEWIVDVSVESETYFLRNKIAKAFGVKAGLGVPILVDGQVQAVFVFFMLEACAKDDGLLELTQAVITQLGQMLPSIDKEPNHQP